MFATLKYRPQSSLSQVGNTAPSRRASTTISRLACVNCRKKKLRCNGDCPACERCQLKGLECTYPKRASRAGSNKNATASADGPAQNKDRPSSPKSAAENTKNLIPDVPNTAPSRPSSAEPDRALSASGEAQMFGTTMLVEDGLDCDNQLPTPVETSNGSCRESRSQSIGADAMSIDADPAFNLSDFDCEFSPAELEFYGLDSFSPLASTIWSNGWLEPTLPSQESTATAVVPPQTQTTESINAHLNTDTTSSSAANFSSSMSTSSTSSSSPKCECVQLAITALEEAAVWTETESFLLAQSALAAHKKSLTQCETLLACTRCASPSSVMMLVLMIFDKLITSFRQIHAFSQSRVGPFSSSSSSSILQEEVVNAAHQEYRRLSLGDYQIDSSGEWSRVMDVLLLFQLSRLGRLLMKVRARVNSSKEESQAQIIQQLEDRLRTFMTNFERSTPFSVC